MPVKTQRFNYYLYICFHIINRSYFFDIEIRLIWLLYQVVFKYIIPLPTPPSFLLHRINAISVLTHIIHVSIDINNNNNNNNNLFQTIVHMDKKK